MFDPRLYLIATPADLRVSTSLSIESSRSFSWPLIVIVRWPLLDSDHGVRRGYRNKERNQQAVNHDWCVVSLLPLVNAPL